MLSLPPRLKIFLHRRFDYFSAMSKQHAVRVGEMMSAVRAALEEREPRLPLRPAPRGRGARSDCCRDGLQALLHGPQALHPEADVIRPGPGDAAALVVEDAPGHESKASGRRSGNGSGRRLSVQRSKPNRSTLELPTSSACRVLSARWLMGARLLARRLDVDRVRFSMSFCDSRRGCPRVCGC